MTSSIRSSGLRRSTTWSCSTRRNGVLHLPLQELAAYASAKFWPAGAIQAAVAGGIGAVIAVVAWILGIPLLSGILMIVGGLLFVMAVYTFVHEGRKTMAARRRTESRRQATERLETGPRALAGPGQDGVVDPVSWPSTRSASRGSLTGSSRR